MCAKGEKTLRVAGTERTGRLGKGERKKKKGEEREGGEHGDGVVMELCTVRGALTGCGWLILVMSI